MNSKKHTLAAPNKRTVWNNRGGNYIGIFGHYIKKFQKNRACTFIRDRRVWGFLWDTETEFFK